MIAGELTYLSSDELQVASRSILTRVAEACDPESRAESVGGGPGSGKSALALTRPEGHLSALGPDWDR